METILIWTITVGFRAMVLDPNLGTAYISSIGIVHGELFADEEALNKSSFNLFYSSVTACVWVEGVLAILKSYTDHPTLRKSLLRIL